MGVTQSDYIPQFRIVQQQDGRWLVDVRGTLPDGSAFRRRIRPKVTTRKQAEKYAEMTWKGAIDGIIKAHKRNIPTVKDFFDRWIDEYATAERHKPSGIEHKRIMFRAHLKDLHEKRLCDITAEDVQRIKAEHAKAKKSPKTTNNALVVLSKMLRTAIEWDVIDDMPRIKMVRVEKKARGFYPVETYEKLIAGAAKTGRVALAAVLLAGDAGLRRGEMLALEWSDVDLVRGVLVVQRSEVYGNVGSTKGNAARHVPITDLLRDALDALPRKGKRVLGGVTPKELRELVERAEAAAKLAVTGYLHVLRHTFASHLAAAGESLYQIQAALGHQDHATTQGYSHLSPDALRPLAEAINRRRQDSGTKLLGPGK